MERRTRQAIDDLKSKEPDMLESVVWQAARFFEECPEDFGIQHAFLPEGVVFGGTNRIVWTVRHGFRCEERYCSERFVQHFNEMMK